MCLNWFPVLAMKNQDISAYLEKCRFLPKLNNEIPGHRNATYKERFSSLENLVLIMVLIFHPSFTLSFTFLWSLLRLILYLCIFLGIQQFEHDTVLIPKETSWFGYYPDGAFKPVLSPNQVYLYIFSWVWSPLLK